MVKTGSGGFTESSVLVAVLHFSNMAINYLRVDQQSDRYLDQ